MRYNYWLWKIITGSGDHYWLWKIITGSGRSLLALEDHYCYANIAYTVNYSSLSKPQAQKVC